MFVPFAPALATSLLIAAASSLPAINIQQTCRAAETAMVQSAGSAPDRANFEACMKSEDGARDQLARDWSIYPAADRAQCINPGAYMPSYVEWLTCLEMMRDARNIKKE